MNEESAKSKQKVTFFDSESQNDENFSEDALFALKLQHKRLQQQLDSDRSHDLSLDDTSK